MLALGGNFFKSILYFCSALGLEAIGFERRQFMPVHVFLPTRSPWGGDHLAGGRRRQCEKADPEGPASETLPALPCRAKPCRTGPRQAKPSLGRPGHTTPSAA
jgi:hypothetical protein